MSNFFVWSNEIIIVHKMDKVMDVASSSAYLSPRCFVQIYRARSAKGLILIYIFITVSSRLIKTDERQEDWSFCFRITFDCAKLTLMVKKI